MTFVDKTTKFIRTSDAPDSPSVIVKDTLTVEDIVFLHARTAAVNKLSPTHAARVTRTMRQQITRVPHGR